MIKILNGNIFESDTEAIVNPVNCVGVMGKGLALQFKNKYPENFNAYFKACQSKEIQPGKVFIFKIESEKNPKYIINFPTKKDWRNNSCLEDIESGLKSLINEIKCLKIKSISIPPLGCGLGGLDWKIVRSIIEKSFNEIKEIEVKLFEPI